MKHKFLLVISSILFLNSCQIHKAYIKPDLPPPPVLYEYPQSIKTEKDLVESYMGLGLKYMETIVYIDALHNTLIGSNIYRKYDTNIGDK